MKSFKDFQLKINNLPSNPGIYYFYDKYDRVIYVGKAASLKNRVKSYFVGAPFDRAQGRHDAKTIKLVSRIANLKYRITDSVIEALILEANEIKRLNPKYNILLKDDKSFAYIFLTREDFPRLLVDRENSTSVSTLTKWKSGSVAKKFGPFTEGGAAQKALEILRRIFGFRDCNIRKFNLYKKKNQSCLFGAIKLCPVPCIGQISQGDYKKIIREITLFLSGKKKTLIKNLKKQMDLASRRQEFELAGKIRGKLFALTHIQDVALIKQERPLEQLKSIPHRIEAYDISNLPAGRHGISGKSATGSMIVFTDGVVDKNQYRKFRIRGKNVECRMQNAELKKRIQHSSFNIHHSKLGDPQMLTQIVDRRLNHPEWPKPDLILLDGGKGQLSAVNRIFHIKKIKIPVISLAKGPSRKGFQLFRNTSAKNIILDKRLLEQMRDEAHRFAINYHRKLRSKNISDNSGKKFGS